MKKSLLLLLCLPFFLSGCASLDLNDYVSERRSYIYLGEGGNYTVKAESGEREYPYATDGYACDTSTLFEVTITCAEHEKNLTISFSVDGKRYGGELSYDSVREEYSYSCGVAVNAESVVFVVGETSVTAERVNAEDKTSDVLHAVAESEKDIFDSLTKGNAFLGEIYVRLIYDEGCYYYVGVADRDGHTHSYLTDESGKLLAKRLD